jgi:hypothetical protein
MPRTSFRGGRGRLGLLGAALVGVGSTLALVIGLGVLAGSGAAAGGAPLNTSPPTITGTVQKGQTLHADHGDWAGTKPLRFAYQWQRCDGKGANCASIGGATRDDYTLGSADVGNTLRVVVTAGNAAGTGTAASAPTAAVATPAAPANSVPPTINGAPQLGQTLTIDPGAWSGPGTITYGYAWLRCDATGASCLPVPGANAQVYVLTQPDVGHTLRAEVTARNANGSTNATSVPSAVVSATANGCPIGARTLSVADVTSPARLSIDHMQFTPSILTRRTTAITARFHVSACGIPVTGALVYATAVPYNQLDNSPEAVTDASGWATLTFETRAGYPVAKHQEHLAMFVRARRPGVSPLGGISTRRLVSVRVVLGS